MIQLDLDVADTCQGRRRGDQAGYGGSGDDSRLLQDEVIGGLRFQLIGAGTTGQRPEFAVGITEADDESGVLCRSVLREERRGQHNQQSEQLLTTMVLHFMLLVLT